MRILGYVFVVLLLVSCNGESIPDCFQNAGEIVRKEIEVSDFSKITVFEKIELVLKEDAAFKIEVETGEFLHDEVQVLVEDGRLILKNENGCNLFRDYRLTKIYVSAPNITEIRSSTGLPISSDGVLAYPNLKLISESFNNPETETTDGKFNLDVMASNIDIVVNGIAYFKLRGEVQNFNVTVAAGDSRIETQELSAQEVIINHRGSNDILVNPQQRISGVIKGTGNVVSYNRPTEIAVDELYKGKLIFRD